jgi:hypothetical protein
LFVCARAHLCVRLPSAAQHSRSIAVVLGSTAYALDHGCPTLEHIAFDLRHLRSIALTGIALFI